MSATEIIVIAFGLFIGYWIVSKLWPGKSGPRAENDDARATQGQSARPAQWHDVLEVAPDSSVEDIRAAYKRLMGEYHPDKVASLGVELRNVAEAKSKEITAAYRQAMQLRGAQA